MDIFQGFIAAFGFNFAPRNWSICAGQLIQISQNSALYSLLADIYGGDNRTVFGLPELRGRVAVGYGQSPGLPAYPIGLKYGVTQQTLDVTQIPSHAHDVTVTAGASGGEATGTLKATTASADHGQPVAGDFLASIGLGRGEFTSSYASPATAGTALVELGGLTVSGGGGGTPTVVVKPTGGNNPISNLQPLLAINYCIVMQGLYPPRN